MHWVAVAVNLLNQKGFFVWRDVRFSGEELFLKRKKALQKEQAMHTCTVPALRLNHAQSTTQAYIFTEQK